MSWEKDYEVEIVCPKCGVIAKYAVFSDDWMRSEDRWIFGKDKVEEVVLSNIPYRERTIYKCKDCGSTCQERVIK